METNEGLTPVETPSTSLLDEDLSSIDTSFPIVKEGIYDLELMTVEEVSTKDQQGSMVKIKFALTEDAQGVSGDVVNKGYPIFHQIVVTPKGGLTMEMVKKSLASVLQPMGMKSLRDLLTAGKQGKIVRVKLVVQPERKDKETGKTYPARNEIKTFLKVS